MRGKVDRDRKLFVSFFFITFFVITLGLFYLLPGKWRVAFLCLMSCLWCAYLDIRSLFILVAGMLYCYLGGILLEWHRDLRKESFVKNQPANSKTDQPLESRKWLLLLLVGFCVLWITVYKLGTYFCTRFCIQVPESILTQLVMPIGFSFYLFQIISYFVDIYRFKFNFKLSDVKLNTSESIDCKLVTLEELIKMHKEQPFLHFERIMKALQQKK